MQGMLRSNCSVQARSCKKHSFLKIQTVPQRITALGPTQTPNRPIPTSRQTHGSKIILMMPGMQILRVRGNPPRRHLGETHIFSTQAPIPSAPCPKVAAPKAFKLRTAIYTLDWRRRIFPAHLLFVSTLWWHWLWKVDVFN